MVMLQQSIALCCFGVGAWLIQIVTAEGTSDAAGQAEENSKNTFGVM